MGCAGFSSLKTVKKNPETEAIPFQDFVFAEDNLFSCDISHKSCYPTGQYNVETYVGMFEEALCNSPVNGIVVESNKQNHTPCNGYNQCHQLKRLFVFYAEKI